MTDQDLINQNLQRQIDAQIARIDNVLTKVDMLVIEAQQQREDLRRLQERQAQDRKELDAKIDSKFDSLGRHIQNLTIAAIVGFGAIVVAIVGLMR